MAVFLIRCSLGACISGCAGRNRGIGGRGLSATVVMLAVLSLACGSAKAQVAEQSQGPASEAATLELVAREYADFEHQFTGDELGAGIPVNLTGLPDGATFDATTKVLKWCPPEGAESRDLLLVPAGQKAGAVPMQRVHLAVQKAYQPAIHLVPQALPLKNKKQTPQNLQEAVRSILEFPISGKPMLKRFDALDKHVRKTQSTSGDDARFEVARAVRIIQVGALTVSDNRVVLDSLNRAVEKSGSAYLAAHSLKLWMLIRTNDIPRATEAISPFAEALLVKGAVSREELMFRLHELGMLIGFMQEKARGAQVTALAKSRDDLLQAFAQEEECVQTIQDGMNRIRVSIREEKLALNERRESKAKDGEQKQQETVEKQEQLTKDLSAADTSLQDVEKKWREEAAPVDAELAPLQDKMKQLSEQYRDLQGDMEVANANIQLNGVDSNGMLVNPSSSTFLQTLQSRCVAIQEKIDKKEVEIRQLEKEMAPLVAKRKAVDQKWNKSRVAAGNEMKKLRRNLGRTSRQVSNQAGKVVAPARFDPVLADFVPIDFDFQRSYLLESFIAGGT